MKNIFRILKYDLQKVQKNVIAMIVIMGITVIPTLYAWFNIGASWDPYGNTSSLKVAVASVDEGYEGELLSVNLNLGDQVISALHENSQLDWIFTSADKAKEGVKSGKYYAAIVIPKDFSKDMMSIFSSDVTHPKITYYINEKENAIAPKITQKGATAVQRQVNSTFIETVSTTALEALQTVNNLTENSGDESLTQKLSASLSQISSDLNSTAGTIQSFVDLSDAATVMLNTTSEFLNQSGSGTKSSVDALKATSTDGIDSLTSALAGTTDTVNQALSQNKEFYTSISDAVDSALDSYTTDAAASANALSDISARVQKVIDKYTLISESLTAIADRHPDLTLLTAGVNSINSQIQNAIEAQTSVKNKLDEAAEAITGATADASSLKKELDDLIATSTSSVSSVKTDYEKQVKGNLSSLASNLDSTSSSVSSLLGQLNDSIKDITDVTGSASGNLTDLQKALKSSVDLITESADKLAKASDTLDKNGSEGIALLSELLSEDPDAIASFLSSPVQLDETKIYPIENYGTAMAPFYSTLAIWVGAVVMAAMLKVNVAESTKRRLFHPKEHQLYIGRLLLFVGIGLIQSGLICLGDLYFLGIQCKHPFLFIVTGWFTSFVYVNLIYALTVSFGDIGKAVAVVLMVMQVAGSGGTFPIQCAPKFFRVVYPLLPFTHSMNAMRECIAGFYGTTYIKELCMLGAFLIPSLLLGLLLRKPIIKLNDAFIEKLEDTKLI